MHKHAGTSGQCVNRVSRVMKLSAGEVGSEARVLFAAGGWTQTPWR